MGIKHDQKGIAVGRLPRRELHADGPGGAGDQNIFHGRTPHGFAALASRDDYQRSLRVLRITAPNGNMMTGPGTNTYLLRAPGSDEVSVLDPGPDDRDLAEAVHALAARR